MKRIDILSLPELANQPHCQKLAMGYKNYCSIRRDLRTANAICEYVIVFHQQMLSDSHVLVRLADTLFLIRGALTHAVLLYARWFKATNRKPSLSPHAFFAEGSADHQVHVRLIELRDKYVAHYELDMLGADRIWACFSSDGKFTGTESDCLLLKGGSIISINRNKLISPRELFCGQGRLS